MKERNLAPNSTKKNSRFTKKPTSPLHSTTIGCRPQRKGLPYIITGGKNTERYYFEHISNLTEYKFTVRPRFCNSESKYYKVFPKWIDEILTNAPDTKIFCVFDFDTIYNNKQNIDNHRAFENNIKKHIKNGNVILCPSMPCFEYWFLLHFDNRTRLFPNNKEVARFLLKCDIKSYFPIPVNISADEFADILKNRDYLEKKDWVEKLCSDEKLKSAVKRAKSNIEKAEKENTLNEQSYSYVYKLFEDYDTQKI